MKKLLCIILAVVLMCTLSVSAFAEGTGAATDGDKIVIDNLALLPEGEAAVVYENEGMKLLIPLEYDELLVTEVPENSPDGTLFTVSEKASVEAAGGEDGAGRLFSIVRISKEKMQEMRCDDMSGNEIFARDADENYYVYRHPTDVRFFRESYENVETDMQIWSELNEWAWGTVRDSFVKENGSLTAERYGNSELEICLARICFADETGYTISTTEFGPKEPGLVDPVPFAGRLMNGVSYELVDGEEAPDGEYVVLNFPEIGCRFDFFRMEGKENYIRWVWGEDYELLYRAVFDDEAVKASEVMSEWYDALVIDEEMRALGFRPDDLVGTWSEKIAGRGVITITKGEAPDTYEVEIGWSAGATESCCWRMTAKPAACNAIRYEDGSMTTIVLDDNGGDTETVNYTGGTGVFRLNSTNELVWEDETGHAGDDTLFINE